MSNKEVEDLTGKKFGYWKVLGRAPDRIDRRGIAIRYWNCQCQCEDKTERKVSERSLKRGDSKSCGCYQKQAVRFITKSKALERSKQKDFWIFKVGEEIETPCSTIKITQQIYNDGTYNKKTGKYYLYDCLTCGYHCDLEHMVYESSIKKGSGCSCCGGGNAVGIGINDIATIAPWMTQYFKNPEDAHKFSIGTRVKTLTKCPDCGYEYPMIVANIYNQGFKCKRCGDGVSYPEKFMISVLEQLNIDYIPQLNKTTFNWCRNYKYDFYLPKYNYIIETHGQQHYDRRGQFIYTSLSQQKETDRIKKELALSNNVTEYIIVDSRNSTKEWMKEHIIMSLGNFIDLSNVNFDLCDQKASSNRVKEICDYYMNHHDMSTVEIGLVFKIAYSTVYSYLKKGSTYGWCDYNPSTALKNSRKKNSTKKPLEAWKDEQYLGKFECATDFADFILNTYNIKLQNNMISQVCNGVNKTTKGFSCKYIETNKNKE